MGRGARARNLLKTVTVRFTGDPAGWAITRAAFDHDAPGLSGRIGHITIGDKGAPERSFNGDAGNAQPLLAPARAILAVPGGTSAVFENGPADYASMPASADGLVFSDARYRALARKAQRI
jgi:hypothetical protein